MALLSSCAAAALNRKAGSDPELRAALAGCAGKVFAIEVARCGRLSFRVGSDGRLQPAHSAIDPDCSARVAGLDPKGMPKWTVEGDAELLKTVSRLVDDPAQGNEFLSCLMQGAAPLWREGRDAFGRLRESVDRYLEYEQGFLVTRKDMAGRMKELADFERRLREVADLGAQLSAASGERGTA